MGHPPWMTLSDNSTFEYPGDYDLPLVSDNTSAVTTSGSNLSAVGIGSATIFGGYTEGYPGAGDWCEGGGYVPCPDSPAFDESSADVSPTVVLSGPAAITVGGYPTSPYTFTANGGPLGGDYTFSADSQIVSLSNTDTSSANSTQITGSEAGTANITVTYSLFEQSAQDSLPVTVLKADNFYVAEDNQGTAACASGPNTNLRLITYTIRSGITQISDPIDLTESVPNPVISSCGIPINTGAGGFNSDTSFPYNGYQITDLLQACLGTAPSCSFSFPNQQWIQTGVGTVATIGAVNVTDTTITVDGNTTSLQGADFNANGKQP